MLVLTGEKWKDRIIRVRKSGDEIIRDDHLWTRTTTMEGKGANFLRHSMKSVR